MNQLLEQGWTTIPNDTSKTLKSLVSAYGLPIPSATNGEVVDILEIHDKENAKPNSLSSRYGSGAFPFHTDCAHHKIPPRIIAMRLREPSKGGQPLRATLIVDIAHYPFTTEECSRLQRDVWIVNTGLTTFSTRIWEKGRFRYDAACMKPAVRSFQASGEILNEACKNAKPHRIQWDESFILLFDNWRVFHGRDKAIPGELRERILERCQLQQTAGVNNVLEP